MWRVGILMLRGLDCRVERSTGARAAPQVLTPTRQSLTQTALTFHSREGGAPTGGSDSAILISVGATTGVILVST